MHTSISTVAARRLRPSHATFGTVCLGRRGKAASVGASISLLSITFVLVLSSVAHAASVSQSAYKIFIKEFNQQIAYSSTQLQSKLTATQTQLASCATTIDELSSSNINAAEAFSDELEDQYTADVAAGIDQPALSAFTSLAKLKLPRTEHKDALFGETLTHKLLTLNTCADLNRWQTTSFSSSTEPANTKEFGQPLAVNLPGVSVTMTLSTSEVKNYNKLQRKASNKTSAVFNTVSDDWVTWSAEFGF